MVEFGLPAPEVMQEYLQNLVNQGYMTMAELATYRVLEDPTSPVSTGGYVVAWGGVPEQGFCLPPH
jgi:hypothetical protein